MGNKKSFDVYYLLVSEGASEYRLFAYLTTNRYRDQFGKSSVKFSDKVELVEIGVSQGRLGGVSNLDHFKSKYALIREKYKGQKRFFVLDKDIDASIDIEQIIKDNGDIIQFLEYNTEYLILRLSKKNPKGPSEFNNLGEFRDYCKSEFEKHFGKKVSDFKDPDFDQVFNIPSYDDVKNAFTELFDTLE